MPPHRRRHKKKLGYWLKKIFPFLSRRNRSGREEFKEKRFTSRSLTLEEVKAAQAEALDRERKAVDSDSVSIFEEAKRPQKPQMHLHRRKKKTLRYYINTFLTNQRLKFWNKKLASKNKSEFQYLTFDDIKGSKNKLEENDSSLEQQISRPIISPGLQQESRPVHEHKHRKKKKRFWKIFRFWKKKKPPTIAVPIGDQDELIKERISLRIYLRSTINSTALFMIAYQVSWFFYQLTVMIVASFSRIDSVLYYYEVLFPVGNYSPKWNQTNIIFITLSGPLISLIFWGLYRFVFLKKTHPGGQMRMFLVWLYLNSMMLFFGAFVGGAITRQGFGYVVDWLYMNIAFRTLFSMIFLTIIVWLSWKVVRFMPENSGLDSWKHNRYAYVLSRLVIPWFIGGGIMVLLKITEVVPQHENIFNYDAFTLATLLFAVVPPMFNSKIKPHLIQGRKTYPRLHKSSVFIWVLVAVLFVSLVRIGLSNGVLFQLIFDLNISFYH